MLKKKMVICISAVAVLLMGTVLFSCSSSSSSGDSIAERFDYDPEAVTPSDTADIAVLKGSWYEMGYQLGEQYKDEVTAATAYNVAAQVEAWGSYEAAVEAYEPYLELADEYFYNEKDGGLTDMIRGTAESTGMSEDDTMMLYIDASSEIVQGEDERDCSAIITWGNATATDEEGCIGSMKADIGYGDLNFMPTMIMFPDNGNAFVSTHGVFGSAVNEKGFMVESPGGSVVNEDDTYRVGIYPSMYLAAYCDTTQEAIDVLGDPETTSEDEWWPLNTDYNLCLGDATGDACVFEVSGTERSLRRNGDTKYVGQTEAGDAIVSNETYDYLCAANYFMSENMLFTSRLNPEVGLDELWPDGLVRYWTLEKYMQDAAKNGGATAESLREAMSSSKYYIPEGWDFDSYPDYGYYGTFVPSDIYEGFEDGTIKREDYYGDSYDAEAWGTALSLNESRSVEEWSSGWHENLTDGWTWNLDISYWSPEPYTPDDKTGLMNIFDSNTKTLYLLKGSANQAISNIPESTGTFATIQFDTDDLAEEYDGDSARAMIQNMYYELEEQIWFSARDLTERNVDPDTATGEIQYGYLDTARELIYEGQSYANLGYLSDNENEKLEYYAEAMSAYVKGQCYAKMAQTDSATLEKDYGKDTPTFNN